MVPKKTICLALFLLASLLMVEDPERGFAQSRGIRIKAKAKEGLSKEIRLYSEYYALVVGCGNYRKGWPRLENPDKDAQEVAQSLKKMHWNVDLLVDPEWSSLRRALNNLILGRGRDRDKAILFWYSGHGHTLKEAGGRELGYIVPVDAPDPDRDELGFMEHAISMRYIETVAKRIQARHVLMLFDCCFSGAIFQAVRSKPNPYIVEKVRMPVRQFITAGRQDEQVPDASLFKTVFLQGIIGGYADRNKDNYVTGTELGGYIQEEVINYSENKQHPKFGTINDPNLDKGDFVFVSEVHVVPDDEAALHVQSKPPGADLSLGDTRKGTTPRLISGLKPGRVKVRISMTGYEPKEQEVRLRAGKKLHLTLTMNPIMPPATLQIQSVPSSAEWYLDGAYAGTTPDEIASLNTGAYRVEVRADGYEPWSCTTRVGPGEIKRITANLEPIDREVGGRSPDGWREPVTGMEFVRIPGGCFQMGSDSGQPDERPIHKVCVDGFWMGRYEVTNAQYCNFKPGHDSGDYRGDPLNKSDQPVVNVSWQDAKGFSDWLTEKSDGQYYFRLPTEAEWEYACKSGGDKSGYGGDGMKALCGFGNVAYRPANRSVSESGNPPCQDRFSSTAPVGSFNPNGFGLYDMLGNVWEWCQDWYDKHYYTTSPLKNPQGPAAGKLRILRGGSWRNHPKVVQSSLRGCLVPGVRDVSRGFRLVALRLKEGSKFDSRVKSH